MVDFLRYFACGSSSENPAAVRQHTSAPLVLLPLFNVGNISVKALPMLVTDDTGVLRGEVQVWVWEMYFRDIVHPIFLDQRKQAKMQWVQDPNQNNVDNLNNVRL